MIDKIYILGDYSVVRDTTSALKATKYHTEIRVVHKEANLYTKAFVFSPRI